jgi:hypothetical protein
VAATRKKKLSASAAARKGWETRRKAERAAARKKAAQARAREAKRRAAAELHARRVLAGKKAARTRLAKARAREALAELRHAVKAGSRRVDRVRDSWHKEKRQLEAVVDDYDRYMAILEELSDDEAPDWDIAYGSTESAA